MSLEKIEARDAVSTDTAARERGAEGDARRLLEEPADALIRAAAWAWRNSKDRETDSGDDAYFKHNWKSLPGLRSYVVEEVVRALLRQIEDLVQERDEARAQLASAVEGAQPLWSGQVASLTLALEKAREGLEKIEKLAPERDPEIDGSTADRNGDWRGRQFANAAKPAWRMGRQAASALSAIEAALGEKKQGLGSSQDTAPAALHWTGAPIPMVLHCPRCGVQHIDEPEEPISQAGGLNPVEPGDDGHWTNPPHRSHLCHNCGLIWRPANVPTVGVESIATVGKADTPREGWTRSPSPPDGPVNTAGARREEIEALADYIRDQVCCPRIHGCELGGSAHCPAERVRALSAPPAETAREAEGWRPDYFVALKLVRAGYARWAAKPHNKRWVRRLDGTSIVDDLLVNIASEIARLPQ